MGTASSRITRFVALLVLGFLFHPVLPASATPDAGPYLIHIERGDSIQAMRLEPATFGMFRYVRTDSVEGYLSGHKIRTITDDTGQDLGRDVLERRRAIGVDPLLYRRQGSSELRPRHRSRREDRTFPLFEVGAYGRLDGPEWPQGGTSWLMSADIGGMRNLSRSYSVGATLHFEADDDREGLGLALRGRRWLSNTLSLDGAAGWMFAGSDDGGPFRGPAFYGETAVNLGDHVQLAARIESRKGLVRYYVHPDSFGLQPWPYLVEVEPKRETLIYLGGKVGSYPGILAFVALLFVLGANTSPVVY